ncbi:MAG: fused MFS/spermidine synthase [Candidatus Glassbacteria bacterium]|nr:fused MFS/spermidine synthase [Candidatus Glassbacteria bacterium]
MRKKPLRGGIGALQYWIYLFFFLSGVSGLVYEIVWMRKLTLIFGNTVHAVSTTLAVFMGGLALGSFLFGRAADRSARPLRMYVLLETGIAVSALLVSAVFLPVLDSTYVFLHRAGLSSGTALFLVRLVLGMGILLVPTVLMGGTLPVMGRFLVRAPAEVGSVMGRLYGLNTLGAVAGSFAAGFWLIASYGEAATVYIAAACNLAVGIGAYVLLRHLGARRAAPAEEPAAAAGPEPETRDTRTARAVLAIYAAAGFASMAYEVLWTRALIYFVGLSVHAFTIILISFLLGLALGSLAVTRLVDRWQKPLLVLGLLQWLIAAAALAGIPLMGKLPSVYQELNLLLGANTYNQISVVKLILCLLVLGVPTLAMGAVFPLVNRLYVRTRQGLAGRVGALYAAGTAGTIIGSLFAGFVLLPAAGIAVSIVAVASVNCLVGAAAFALRDKPPAARLWPAAACLGSLAAGALALGAGGALGPVVGYSLKNSGKQVLYCRETTEASLAVLKNNTGDRELNINGESTAYTGFEDIVIHKFLAHLPLLLHRDPSSILVVGFGFGSTVYSASRYGLKDLECVELVPEEVKTAPYFLPENHGILDSGLVRMVFDDGRNHILTTGSGYDVISFNAIHPKLSPMLYTYDFYRLCARVLNPGGTICAWLPTNGFSLYEFKVLLRTFQEVFPHSSLWYNNPANLILLGSIDPLRIDYPELRDRISAPEISRDLHEVRLEDPLALLACFMTGEGRLRELTADVPLNTDSRPIIEFSRTAAPVVSTEIYHWLMESLEPVSGYLDWEDSGRPQPDSLEQVRASCDHWLAARKLFYRGKFASWVFKEYPTATRLYQRALQANPADGYIKYFLEDRWTDPDSLARAAAADPGDYISRYALGAHCLQQGEGSEARRWFREVVAIRPGYAEAWFQLGVCEELLGNPAASERNFLRALEIHPASPQTLINLGLWAYRRNDLDRALGYYRQAVKIAPYDGTVLFFLGNLYLRRGERAGAERMFRRSIALDPLKPESYLNLGALLTNRGQYEEAIRSFRQALELDPAQRTAYLNLALTYEKMGDTARAGHYRSLAESLGRRLQDTGAGAGNP